jgi:catalase
MAQALTFELSKVETEAVRLRMLGHLALIDDTLSSEVRDGLGVDGGVPKLTPAREPLDLKVSPALRLFGKYEDTLMGRKVGILLGGGFDPEILAALVAAIEKEGANTAIVAAKIQGEFESGGKMHAVEMALRASPSVLFDAVVVLSGSDGDKKLAADPNAVAFLMDADRHCKAIGWAGVPALSGKAGLKGAEGMVPLVAKTAIKDFIKAARIGRFWDREEDKP